MPTIDIQTMAAGERCGASAGSCPSRACDRQATFASRGDPRPSQDGMNDHDRPIGPETMR